MPKGALLLAAALAAAAPAADLKPVITFDNQAGIAPDEMASIERDFRDWAARVYRYHEATPGPVTVRITNKVPFGFYSEGAVMLPPNERWTMLDDFVHELTHHVTGHDSSFFMKEGASVHTLEALFGQEGRVPNAWPQFGQTTDAWVALYVARGRMMRLEEALAWPRYRGDTPDNDFRSWQIYNIAGSFTGWYLKRYGRVAWRDAVRKQWPAQDSGELEKAWLADVAARKPPAFDAAAVIPRGRRYNGYIERLSR
ncbi:MAG: hypothetical protein ACRETF_08040 [Nevskiaceae bacterium]